MKEESQKVRELVWKPEYSAYDVKKKNDPKLNKYKTNVF